MKRSCGTCEWWGALSWHAETPRFGVCHGGPPTAAPNGNGVWPLTPEDQRCGAWRVAERLTKHPDGIDAAAAEEVQA